MPHIGATTALGVALLIAALAGARWDTGVTASGTPTLSGLLDGVQAGTASAAMGSATVTLDEDTDLLSWTLSWSDITTEVTAIHFHGPASPGESAFVTVELGFLSGLSSPSIGSETISEAQQAELLSGLWYINIHSQDYIDGELRGQLLLAGKPPPTPTPEPTSTATPPLLVFTNDSGQAAGFLHLQSVPSFSSLPSVNAPGCGAPSVASGFEYWELTWPSACVDPGERVTFDAPEFLDVFSHYWAPSVPVVSAVNDTGRLADGLSISPGGFVKGASVVENAPGCGDPGVRFVGEGQVDLVWDAPCVVPGEKVSVHIGMTAPVTQAPYTWSTVVTFGDVSCDGAADSVDAALVLQLEAGLIALLTCIGNADVNGDGRTNALDAALILQFTAGLLNVLPV